MEIESKIVRPVGYLKNGQGIVFAVYDSCYLRQLDGVYKPSDQTEWNDQIRKISSVLQPKNTPIIS